MSIEGIIVLAKVWAVAYALQKVGLLRPTVRLFKAAGGRRRRSAGPAYTVEEQRRRREQRYRRRRYV